jgi:hypothetical protein
LLQLAWQLISRLPRVAFLPWLPLQLVFLLAPLLLLIVLVIRFVLS